MSKYSRRGASPRAGEPDPTAPEAPVASGESSQESANVGAGQGTSSMSTRPQAGRIAVPMRSRPAIRGRLRNVSPAYRTSGPANPTGRSRTTRRLLATVDPRLPAASVAATVNR